jgi:hypothetical protein
VVSKQCELCCVTRSLVRRKNFEINTSYPMFSISTTFVDFTTTVNSKLRRAWCAFSDSQCAIMAIMLLCVHFNVSRF